MNRFIKQFHSGASFAALTLFNLAQARLYNYEEECIIGCDSQSKLECSAQHSVYEAFVKCVDEVRLKCFQNNSCDENPKSVLSSWATQCVFDCRLQSELDCTQSQNVSTFQDCFLKNIGECFSSKDNCTPQVTGLHVGMSIAILTIFGCFIGYGCYHHCKRKDIGGLAMSSTAGASCSGGSSGYTLFT